MYVVSHPTISKLTETFLFRHFPKRWSRMNTQREGTLVKFDFWRKFLFVWKTWLINLKAFPQLDEISKEAGMGDKQVQNK